ncbi:hypothetical protein COO60DRAFT_1569166 [Scenedesmus sp. NREL 46B-D3]|nr:hypothetical protein COO60DRAFT_1569166 [Scenedesmus sp. NREL 46B-D3]
MWWVCVAGVPAWQALAWCVSPSAQWCCAAARGEAHMHAHTHAHAHVSVVVAVCWGLIAGRVAAQPDGAVVGSAVCHQLAWRCVYVYVCCVRAWADAAGGKCAGPRLCSCGRLAPSDCRSQCGVLHRAPGVHRRGDGLALVHWCSWWCVGSRRSIYNLEHCRHKVLPNAG